MSRALALLAVLIICQPAAARHDKSLPTGRSGVDIAATRTPDGWTDFCNRYTWTCPSGTEEPEKAKLDQNLWQNLNDVNNSVNNAVSVIEDEKRWNRREQWDLPYDVGYQGDCEDFALQKWKLLQKYVSRSALSVATVRDTDGVGHAVLMVRTDHGDLILDNLNRKIVTYDKTRYRYLKRMSATDPNIWVTFR